MCLKITGAIKLLLSSISSTEGIIFAILGDDEATLYDGDQWTGSLTTLEGFNGYWFKSNADIDFSFNIPDDGDVARASIPEKEVLSGYEYNRSTQRSFYFIKECPQAEIGDWIIAMHNDVVVGARKWNGNVIDVPAMGYDNESYSSGYLEEGNIPELMLYHYKTGELESLYGNIPAFANNEIFVINELTDEDSVLPGEITLQDAYPNPFNPVTNITFSIPEAMNIELNVYDIQGRLVKQIIQGMYEQGEHHVILNGENLSSGLYFVQLLTENSSKYSKVLLLK